MVAPTYRAQIEKELLTTSPATMTSGFQTNNKEFEGRGFIIKRVAPQEDSRPFIK